MLSARPKTSEPQSDPGSPPQSLSEFSVGNLLALLEHPTVQWVVLMSASFLVLFAQANHSGLRGDSIYYAALARRIADSGEYATLRFGQELNHHGPLFFWLSAFAIKLFGPTPFAATLISRVFGVGCIVLTALLGSRLVGNKVGWIAALALLTSYVFFRNAVAARLETALMFGVLLALFGYFSGKRSWGPPVFYCGIVIAVLAKSVAGLVPLGLALLHALISGRLRWPWHKASIRWICWAFVLLIAVAWWAYLMLHYGTQPITEYVTDFLVEKRTGPSRLQQFVEVYLSDLGFRYWPWLPFALLGLWTLCRNAADKSNGVEQRADAAFVVAWFGIVLFAGILKPAQYGRYLLPAYPALSIMTGAGIIHILKGRFPPWIPGFVALATLIGAITLACFPTDGSEKQTFSTMAALLDSRLPRGTPVTLVTTAVDDDGNLKSSWVDETRFQFFFGRAARPTTVATIKEAAAHGRITFISATGTYRKIAGTLKPSALIRTDNYVLAETGAGQEVVPP